jgi:hypothetical protein
LESLPHAIATIERGNMKCQRKECIEQWEEYVSDEEDNARGYSDGSYTCTHCQVSGCHSIYWKGKNGGTCEGCRLEACEGCQDDGTFNDEYGVWYCASCAASASAANKKRKIITVDSDSESESESDADDDAIDFPFTGKQRELLKAFNEDMGPARGKRLANELGYSACYDALAWSYTQEWKKSGGSHTTLCRMLKGIPQSLAAYGVRESLSPCYI